MNIKVVNIYEDRYGQEDSRVEEEYKNVTEARMKRTSLFFETEDGKEIELYARHGVEIYISNEND